MLEQHLALAEEHVALGERHIARQRELVAELDKAKHDTVEARQLLVLFEEAQQQHLSHRHRLLSELAAHVSEAE